MDFVAFVDVGRWESVCTLVTVVLNSRKTVENFDTGWSVVDRVAGEDVGPFEARFPLVPEGVLVLEPCEIAEVPVSRTTPEEALAIVLAVACVRG